MSRLPYRPDIDGLRAIAVALVVAFHFGVPGFDGGFIGVDLFFVISGFLIASIFARQPDMTLAGLLAFYGRRIQRLAPAFVLVAVVTVAVASVLLLPDDYVAFLKSLRESLVTRANLYFEHETTGYFAASAKEMPWLHTWSLSVEWQFYLFFPLVAVALRRVPNPRLRTIACTAIVVAGAGLSIWMVETRPAHAYFSAAARFFEFFLGVLAASSTGPWRRAAAKVISATGVVSLLVLGAVFTAETPFPGVAALAVCGIGAVLLVSGDGTSLLADRRLVAIGQRSYAIYLWHWPVVAMLNYVQHRPTGLEIAAWFVAIYAIADATWRWVERPGMATPWRPRTAFVVWCVLPFACAALGYVFVRNHGGFPQRLGADAQHADANLKRFDSRALDLCHDYASDDLEPCAFGDRASSTRALMIGDSHARHFRPFAEVLAEDARVKVYGLTDSVCLALEGARAMPDSARQEHCVAATARDYALIRGGRFAYVILAERWIGYPSASLAALDASLATIVASGAVPVIFLPAAEDGSSTKDCFDLHIKIRAPYADDCGIRADNAFAAPAKAHVADLMREMKRRHPSLILIDPQAVQCRDGTCTTVIDRTPIYTDFHHLSAYGSTMLGRAYLERVGNPLSRGSVGGQGGVATPRRVPP